MSEASKRDSLRAWLSDDVIETLGLEPTAISGGALASRVDQAKQRALWRLRARARERMVGLLDAADSDALWIGWAGPMSSDTRANLLTRDLARLERLLDDPANAVRLVFAGGPVDADGAGAAAQLAELADDHRFDGRIFYKPGWPNSSARMLVEGVDLWLTTAAPGTDIDDSLALAAAANGALQASTMVDWWAGIEGTDKGWTIGGTREFDDREAQDEHDARVLFSLLERDIVPTFYDWDGEGVPLRWLERVRATMRSLPVRWDGSA